MKNCGGTVIVQVDEKISSDKMLCKSVKIPKIYVDYIVVVSEEEDKRQVLGMKNTPLITAVHCDKNQTLKEEKMKAQIKRELRLN